MIYTVIGVVDNTTVPRELTVAAVLLGQHTACDEKSGPETAQRWADVIEADNPDEAEGEAHLLVAGMED